MERNALVIYATVLITVLVVSSITVAIFLHNPASKEAIYPLGDKNLQFDRDVGVGTVYVMTATGSDDISTFQDGQLQDTHSYSVTGERRVEVTAADESTYTYLVTTRLVEDGRETSHSSTYVIDRKTGEIVGSPDALTLNNSSIPKDDVYDRWGPHHLDGSSWTIGAHGSVFELFVFVGVDDKVCYQINESFETGSKDEGHTESYTLEYLLYSMDFKKF